MNCPHCGYGADPGEEECPLCGTPLDRAEREQARGTADAPAPAAGPRDGEEAAGRTPWEAEGGIGSFFSSWWESLSAPNRFFSRVDWRGGLEAPLLYFLFFSVVGAACGAFWSAVMGSAMSPVAATESLGLPAGSSLLQFFLAPFMALVSLAFWIAFAHVGVRLLASDPRPIRATARALCYTSGPQVLLVVPFVGGLAAMAWSAVLAVVGIRRAHRTSTGRAVGVLVIVFAMFVGSSLLLAVLLFAAMGGSLPFPAAR